MHILPWNIVLYIQSTLFVMLLLGTLYLPFRFILCKKRISRNRLVYLLLGGYAFLILTATISTGTSINLSALLHFRSAEHFYNLVPFRFLTEEWLMGKEAQNAQSLANFLMFVPLGILLPMAFPGLRRFWKVSLCLALFSFSIEFTQFFIGRTADIDDLLLNSTGGMSGYGIYRYWVRIRTSLRKPYGKSRNKEVKS